MARKNGSKLTQQTGNVMVQTTPGGMPATMSVDEALKFCSQHPQVKIIETDRMSAKTLKENGFTS